MLKGLYGIYAVNSNIVPLLGCFCSFQWDVVEWFWLGNVIYCLKVISSLLLQPCFYHNRNDSSFFWLPEQELLWLRWGPEDRFPVEQPPPAPPLCVKSWTKCSTRLRCSSATTLLSGPSPFVNRPRLWPTSGGAQLSRSPRLKEAVVAFRSNAQRRFLRCHVSSWKGETGKHIQSVLGQVPSCVSVKITQCQLIQFLLSCQSVKLVANKNLFSMGFVLTICL